MPAIEPELLKNLDKYRYSSVDKSLLSKYVLQPYWTWLVTWVPLWVAPNLLTLIGLLFIVGALSVQLAFTPNLDGPAPNWTYVLCAVCLWIYQSLDAIDGKQARRTGTSSPLGQLFDHGCDALNTTLVALMAVSALDLNNSWLSVVSIVMSLANFYLATWEEFYTGSLYFGLFSGPIEGIITIIGVFLWSAVVGPAWWSQPLVNVVPMSVTKMFGIPSWLAINAFFVVACSGLVFCILAQSIHTVYKTTTATKSKKASSWMPFGEALLGLLPFTTLSATFVLILLHVPGFLSHNFTVALLGLGVAFSNIVGHIIVDHVTGALFPIYQQVTLPYAVVAVTCAFVDNFVPAVDLSPYGTWIAWSLLAYTLFIHGEYVLALIDEICAYLDINCLTIKYKSKASPMVEKKAAAAALATPSKSKQTTPKKVKAAVTPARRQSPRNSARNSARKMH